MQHQLDFNFNRNKKTKEHLKSLNLKWSYSSSKGFYIGFKATVILDYDCMNPVSILRLLSLETNNNRDMMIKVMLAGAAAIQPLPY